MGLNAPFLYMKKVLVACAYDDLIYLERSLKNKTKKSPITVVSYRDIVALDADYLYTDKKHKIKSFKSAFIRYPYDLIEPHAKTYQKREKTELLKTISLLFSDISINPLQKAHFVRNRLYSLKKARECGLSVPKSIIFSEYIDIELPDKKMSKSLGNCFFSEKVQKNRNISRGVISLEKDGNDHAYIYLPHQIENKNDLRRHIKDFSVCFLQEYIKGQEYRIYVVGKKFFVYEREVGERVDGSFSKLKKSNKNIGLGNTKGIIMLMKITGLDYLCIDAISSKKGLLVIDINPYGSFPDYSECPEITDAVADFLLK